MLQKVLIANRGEIAIRIARSAADAGIRSLAVFSEDDADCLHRFKSDDAVALRGRGPRAYLDGAQLVEIALRNGCDAIHPGYGFLSENAAFAESCERGGIIFVGPRPQTLALFGDKARAREMAASCGVPVAAGTEGAVSLEQAHAFLASLGSGAAVMVKAVAGGGGRGMRPVRSVSDLDAAFERCRSEARNAFGQGDLYLEQFVEGARHIEVQIVGDGQGGITHLYERDCSTQRQRQKLIEIAPSVGLRPEVRKSLFDAACRMAGESGYRSLCTFEFLVSDALPRGFIFIEANPRLQVEHTVTEEVLGVDLVHAQLRIAAGARLVELGLDQASIAQPRGYAVQLRVNTETMQADGSATPTGGRLIAFDPPTGSGVRVETCGYPQYATNPGFDSLLAKLIVHSPATDLPSALSRAYRALCEFRIEGVQTNIGFLQNMLLRPELGAGAVAVDFVERHAAALAAPPVSPHPSYFAKGAAAAAAAAEATPAVLPIEAPPGTIGAHAPSQGVVVFVAQSGTGVRKGETLAVVEAMKMEHSVVAETDGTVTVVLKEVGDAVAAHEPVLFFEPGEIAHDGEVARGSGQAPDSAQALAPCQAAQDGLLDAARPEAVARQHSRAEMTARERIDCLCDPGTFVEIGGLVTDEELQNAPADGLVLGTGRVDGRYVVVFAQDFTVYGGSSGILGSMKLIHAAAQARKHGLPLVMLLDGGGHRIQTGQNSRHFAAADTLFQELVLMTGWVPMVAAMLGPGFAANTNYSACSDFLAMVRGQSAMGLAGPALVRAGTGEEISIEALGGASVQVDRTGLADLGVDDEREAIDSIRRFLSYLPSNARQPAPAAASWEAPSSDELLGLVPANTRKTYDVRHVIEHVADVGSVFESKPTFARNIVTALARIEGRPVGFIANQPAVSSGMLDSPACEKAARFIALCDAYGLPIIYLADIPGFSIGSTAESTQLGRRSAKMLFELGHATVPRISVILRKGYGLGYFAMAGGRSFDADAVLAWPTAEICAMSIEGSVDVAYRKQFAGREDAASRRQAIIDQIRSKVGPLQAASGFGIDDIIDPRQTRARIADVLARAPARRQLQAPPKFRAISPI